MNATTFVDGSAHPAAGLSGAIRWAAYRIPDHRPSHWLVLMAGDTVDVYGSAAIRALRSPRGRLAVAAAAFAAAAFLVRTARR